MRANDGVRTHCAVLDAGQMHRAALAAHEAAAPAHELAQNPRHRGAPQQRVVVPAIRAKGVVIRAHSRSESGRYRFLAEREMARALNEILHEQIVGALLHLPGARHHLIQLEPQLRIDSGEIVPGGAAQRPAQHTLL
jgi:hypothetical protein